MRQRFDNVRTMISRHWEGAALPWPRRGWDGRWTFLRRRRARWNDMRKHHRATLLWALQHPLKAWRLWSR